jgi:hypothetical protein
MPRFLTRLAFSVASALMPQDVGRRRRASRATDVEIVIGDLKETERCERGRRS